MTHSSAVRVMRRVYRAMMLAYPPDFRRCYGRDMEQVFTDRCRSVARTHGLPGLLRFGLHTATDWMITTIREGMASMLAPPEVAAAQVLDGVPGFYLLENSRPRRSALFNGAVLSLAIFIVFPFVAGKRGRPRPILMGSHHPSRSHLLPVRSTAASTDLDTEVRMPAYPDEPRISDYFKLILVLSALDLDRDNVISAAEIAHAPRSLRKIDTNYDGTLSAEDCGFRMSKKQEGEAATVPTVGCDARFEETRKARPRFEDRARLAFMRVHPVLRALDTDRSGDISPCEIKYAPVSLLTLDKNRDGKLTEDELLPDLVISRAAGLMAMLDLDGDRQISREERSDEFAHRSMKLLERADKNRDGLVTEEELALAILSQR